MPVIHFEYTQFYYPGDMEFPGENQYFDLCSIATPYHFQYRPQGDISGWEQTLDSGLM